MFNASADTFKSLSYNDQKTTKYIHWQPMSYWVCHTPGNHTNTQLVVLANPSQRMLSAEEADNMHSLTGCENLQTYMLISNMHCDCRRRRRRTKPLQACKLPFPFISFHLIDSTVYSIHLFHSFIPSFIFISSLFPCVLVHYPSSSRPQTTPPPTYPYPYGYLCPPASTSMI